LDITYSFRIEGYSLIKISSIFVVAENLIELQFSDSLVVLDDYLNPNTYSILDDALKAVQVSSVLDPGTTMSTSVFLVTKGLSSSKSYQLNIGVGILFDRNGKSLDAQHVAWTMHRTKVDSTVNSLAKFYNTRSRGVIRGLIEAIMISDEKIGGSF
jgi:hypothetical protein